MYANAALDSIADTELAVFYEGAVIRQGTHVELVADENGKYYELWYARAQYYTEKIA